ncbi:hypothetical protein VPH35_031060 [Triticum aestivum]
MAFGLPRAAAAVVTLVLGLAAASAVADDVEMVFLKSAVAKGAVCLDGSAPVYHFSPGSGSGANNWIVHMEGGGWCKTPEECVIRKGNFRGSSKFMKPLSFSGILGGSQQFNPDFYNWNRVKVRYCDGSSFTGDVEEVDPKTNLHFRGARVWDAIIEDLLNKGMSKAKNAILSGCSAGGLSAILHCDKFKDLLPPSAFVKCVSDAGYFIDGTDITGNKFVRTSFKSVATLHGSIKNLPSSCTSRIRNILVPSAADKKKEWAKCKVDIKGCSSSQLVTLQHFRDEFLSALPKPEQSPKIGMFIDSCFAHCQSGAQDSWNADSSPSIQKMRIGKAVGDWYFDRAVSQRVDCPYPCNPSCIDNEDD